MEYFPPFSVFRFPFRRNNRQRHLADGVYTFINRSIWRLIHGYLRVFVSIGQRLDEQIDKKKKRKVKNWWKRLKVYFKPIRLPDDNVRVENRIRGGHLFNRPLPFHVHEIRFLIRNPPSYEIIANTESIGLHRNRYADRSRAIDWWRRTWPATHAVPIGSRQEEVERRRRRAKTRPEVAR